jgi:hypothetical protein
MSQLQITRRHRAASARRRGETEQLLPLDPRDPDITRAKQLQRRSRKPSESSADGFYPAISPARTDGCCTKIKEADSLIGTRPLTCVGDTGIEPVTSSV